MSESDKISSGSVVYLIDNNRENLDVIKNALKKEHYIVQQYSDYKTALTQTQENLPDVILFNINIPGEDGYRICREFKVNALTSAIPMIFVCDNKNTIDKVKAYTSGCADIIIKPFVNDEIISKVNIHRMHYILKQELGILKKEGKEITERKLLETLKTDREIKEKMFIRTQRLVALGELLSAMVHEIRQPLHGMKLIVEGIIYWENRKNVKDKKSKDNIDHLSKVIQGIDRIDNLIDTIYISIKPKSRIKVEPINFNGIIREVLDIFQHKIKYHRIELKTELDPGIGNIQCTHIQAEQIVINLISNAIKALDKIDKKNKTIIIRTRELQDHLLLEIIDNGPGIKEDIKENIFNPLFTTEHEKESLGMGLYIVHTILDSFNATIDVLNNSYGGATFRIKLIRRKKEV